MAHNKLFFGRQCLNKIKSSKLMPCLFLKFCSCVQNKAIFNLSYLCLCIKSEHVRLKIMDLNIRLAGWDLTGSDSDVELFAQAH